LSFFINFRSEEELHNVVVTHKPPEGFIDKVSLGEMGILLLPSYYSGYSDTCLNCTL